MTALRRCRETRAGKAALSLRERISRPHQTGSTNGVAFALAGISRSEMATLRDGTTPHGGCLFTRLCDIPVDIALDTPGWIPQNVM
jgi:hypothetical protein